FFQADDGIRGRKVTGVQTCALPILKKIINEMILLAKLDSEQEIYEAEKVQISVVIDQVSARCVPLMNEPGIAFYRDIQQDVPLVVDEEKFLRALLNLVFNGI